jgi:hypothetical protein
LPGQIQEVDVKKNQLSGEGADAVNGLLLWRSSRPEEFVEKFGRLVWEVVLADPLNDGTDDLVERMEVAFAAR